MAYLPVFVDLARTNCLVVGGGEIAERKIEALLTAGASVSVIASVLTPALQELVGQGRVRHLDRDYREGDMAAYSLVYGARGNAALDRTLFEEALHRGILINVPDVPELCSFITPAVVKRGDFAIAISTAGGSPALSRRMREQLERDYGPEYAIFVSILRAARSLLRRRKSDGVDRRAVLHALASSDMPQKIAARDLSAVEATLRKTLGQDVSLVSLGIEWPGSEARTAARP